MTQYLVFDNDDSSLTGLLQKQMVVNCDEIKYIEPINVNKFRIELDNGGSILIGVSSSKALDVVKKVRSMISAMISARVLEVKPDHLNQWKITQFAFSSSIHGNTSVFVSPSGTPAENGVALLDAYDRAEAKIVDTVNIQAHTTTAFESWMNKGGGEYQFLFSPAANVGATPEDVTYQWTADFGDGVKTYDIYISRRYSTSNMKFVVSLGGVAQTALTFPNNATIGFPIREVKTSVTTLVIGPGEYEIPSDLEINNLVNVVGLVNNEEVVKITGNGVLVKAGANNSTYPITIGGFTTAGLWMESNLPHITYREIRSTAQGSFQPKNFGAGSVDGTFIRCCSTYRSFGSGNDDTVSTGVSADGTFLECQATQSFASYMADSSGLYIRCNNSGGYIGNIDDYRFYQLSYTFGYRADTFNGYLTGCGGDYQAFGAYANTIGATFVNCEAVQRGFAYKAVTNNGKFMDCTSSSNYSFSGVAQGDHSGAMYINCSAFNSFSFGAPDQYGGSTPCEATFINCTTTGSFPFGGGPSYYSLKECHAKVLNCCALGAVGNGDFPATAGNGKIVNGIDPSYTVINR